MIKMTFGRSVSLAAAAAGICACLIHARPDPRHLVLVTLESRAEDASQPRGGPGRSWIALAGPGEEPRILTGAFWSATSPAVSYDGRRFLFAGRRGAAGPARIWEMRLDGSGERAVTPERGEPADPAYLPDGRIIFSDGVPPRPQAQGVRALFSCAPDGSDVRRLTFGLDGEARPAVLPDGRVRFERSSVPPVALAMHPDGTGAALLHEDGVPGPAPEILSGVRPPVGQMIAGAVRVAARPVPPVLTSVVNATRATGTLLCLDVYASQDPAVASLPRGTIDRVRVAAARPGPAAGDAGPEEDVLGEAPVLPDGSFFVEVPAATLLRLTLLRRDGRTLAALKSGIWVRPNENR
ncbi:MAG: hypothetical protein AAB297_01020, partial [Acidobacteriota bacterium]